MKNASRRKTTISNEKIIAPSLNNSITAVKENFEKTLKVFWTRWETILVVDIVGREKKIKKTNTGFSLPVLDWCNTIFGGWKDASDYGRRGPGRYNNYRSGTLRAEPVLEVEEHFRDPADRFRVSVMCGVCAIRYHHLVVV